METITLVINGETRAVPEVPNILELIRYLNIAENGIAVELNKNIIRRRNWENTPVRNQDKLEIVQLVGGG
jgi:thiamine biosynthesis protein ThiS